jgi:hypothetical protein
MFVYCSFTISHFVINLFVSRESMEGLIGPVRSFAAVAALEGPKNKTHILWITIISIFVIVPGIMRQVIRSINDNKGIIIAAVEFANYNSRMPTTICCLIMTNLRAGYVTDFITSARTLDKKFTNMGFPVDYEVVKRSGPSLVGLVLFKLALQQIPFLSQGESRSRKLHLFLRFSRFLLGSNRLPRLHHLQHPHFHHSRPSHSVDCLPDNFTPPLQNSQHHCQNVALPSLLGQ